MAKAVFRPGELVLVPETLMIQTPERFQGFVDFPVGETETEVETVSGGEPYLGPTADELRREAEEFKALWEFEKENLLEAANVEAEGIIRAAREASEAENLRSTEQAAAIKAGAEEEAEKLIQEARGRADELSRSAETAFKEERKKAVARGVEEGKAEGFAAGQVEVERLIERTRAVLERAQDKRAEILSDTEREIVELVLLVCRKVVKTISESQREVVVANVVQALRKVKDRGNIIIRVNTADLKLATAHTQNFIKLLEGAKSIQVAEDSSVDAGGCVIETDFGEIDARIASQLAELETKILEVSPIRSKAKSGTAR
ncbi:MAG: flagellar assembly protein FliH [Treponema sp.]|nr:flagellar assembly protein FliH [Treponema sp.]